MDLRRERKHYARDLTRIYKTCKASSIPPLLLEAACNKLQCHHDDDDMDERDRNRDEEPAAKRARAAINDREKEKETTDNGKTVVTVFLRGDLTTRTFQAWQQNLPKRIPTTPHSRQLSLTLDILPNTSLIVMSKAVGYNAYKLWIGQREVPIQVKLISSEWITGMLKSGHYQDPLDFELKDLKLDIKSPTTDDTTVPLTKATTVPVPVVKSVLDAKAKTTTVNALPLDKRTYACIQTGNLQKLNENRYITDILEELQTIYELVGDEWRALGYKKCIGLLKQLPKITRIEQVNGVKGVGASISEKIEEILETGFLKKLDNFKNDPKIKSLTELSGIWGVGEKKASDLMKKGFKNIQALRESGTHLLTTQQKIGLQHYEELKVKIPRSEVEEIRDTVLEHCQRIAPNSSCTVCGSYRRGKPQSGDVDVLICPPPGVAELPSETLPNILRSLEECGFLTDHLSVPNGFYNSAALPGPPTDSNDSRKSNGADDDEQINHIKTIARHRASYMGVCRLLKPGSIHRRIDIKIYPAGLYPFAILYFTGSDHFNRSMRFYAKKRGFSLSDKGLIYEERVNRYPNFPYEVGHYIPCSSEEEIFKALNLEYKAPHDRNVFDVDHQFTEDERREAKRRPILQDSSDSE